MLYGQAPTEAASQAGTAAKPIEHLIGTVTAIDSATQSITVKEDKTNKEQIVLLGGTRTLLKVPAGAKDLKQAARITAGDLAVGDRVDVRGNKAPNAPDKIAARSLVLMSGRELAAVHQAQAAEWQRAVGGVVSSVDPAAQKIIFSERTSQGPKQVTVAVSPQTEFTRYSPQNPETPAASQLSEIQPGDQIRVIGDPSADGTTISGRRIYTGAFRTLNGTITSIAPDGSQIVIKDLRTKNPVTVTLNSATQIKTIPPEMAQMIAARANAGSRQGGAPTGWAPRQQGSEAGTSGEAGGPASPDRAAGSGSPGTRGPHSGDISRLIERLPNVNIADLKPGQTVVVAGAAESADNSKIAATHVIAGVEPILQAAPARQRGGETLGGDWGLGEMSVPQ